jgi:thiamine-phosphate pyrophosphorylase
MLPDRIFVIGNAHNDDEAAGMAAYAAALAAGGCRWFSLRAKTLDEAARARTLAAIREAAPSLTLSVHGTFVPGADGVHLGTGGSIAGAREMGAPLVGISCHTVDELQRAADAGADYATYSPIFPTVSKPGYGPALGLDALCAACDAVALPIVALGGIELSNARACIDAGAAAVAVLGAFAKAQDPARAFADMRRAI